MPYILERAELLTRTTHSELIEPGTGRRLLEKPAGTLTPWIVYSNKFRRSS
jgi:hypothetical protein